ncbi:MAG: twin-arginine translocation signal domain-containing protein [Planctomycetes bacterium]|nr:twin-arginine translocation signal domain-containing protein [Planctomycetota bacterium]
MNANSRRDFLRNIGAGAVAAGIGTDLAADLGVSTAFAQQGTARLTFGTLEPLVTLMQETTADRLIPQVVERLRNGTSLRDVVAAAALANARTFGGEDYIGFHTMMAIGPAYHMAQELPEARRALPVLKVLHRNATRIQAQGGRTREVLHPVQGVAIPNGRVGGEVLRDQLRQPNVNDAERTFATLARNADDALNNVLYAVEDGADVHRVALPYRAWDLMGIIGREQAHTLLRQSVRFCARSESPNYRRYMNPLRTALPRWLDQHRLVGRELGSRRMEDRWIEDFSMTLFRATPDRAADAAAAALADGIDPAAIGEAISLAANQLVLRDNGRTAAQASPPKPVGSVHGDSTGVHGCDSANAWRNLARVANQRNKVVCLLLGAWQVARDRANGTGNFIELQPYPREDARNAARNVEPARLLGALEEAIRGRDQARAAAIAHRYTTTDRPVRPLWDTLLRYAISEDGALHHEKFYRTSAEEYNSVRPAFRSRYLIALARVTASGHGYAAPGHTEACRLLNA